MSGPVLIETSPSWGATSSTRAHHTSRANTVPDEHSQYEANMETMSLYSQSPLLATDLVSAPKNSVSSSTNTIPEDEETRLQDLDRYIALGCLHIEQPVSFTQGPPSRRKWVEILHLEKLDELKISIGKEAAWLLEARWVRLFLYQPQPTSAVSGKIVRVYVLPEDWGRRSIDRNSKSLKNSLRQLLQDIDISPKAWYGDSGEGEVRRFDPWAEAELSSLYYLFNTLLSPAPVPESIKNRYTRAAVHDLFKSATVSDWEEHGEQALAGLKTRLYAYQARSASLMLQREAAPQLQLDPRLETRASPNGQRFYFGARDGSFLQEPRYYETTRGGILAETMGLGKTIICLAVILASKHHLPKIPVAYQPPSPRRNRVGSLADMAASIMGRHSIPAKAFLEESEGNGAGDLTNLKDTLERNIPFYEIPPDNSRRNRTTRTQIPHRLVLSSATIIVVPRNLLHQWQSEIHKHVLPGGLKVLILDTVPKRGRKTKDIPDFGDDMEFQSELPAPTKLLKYDVVLFTRNRFEQEIPDVKDNSGQRVPGVSQTCGCPYIGSTRVLDCNCVNVDRLYESPLKKIHWLRIIIDEGHSFSSSVSNAVLLAKQIQAERRWVVSGTPARNLVGVEVDMSTTDLDGCDLMAQRELAIEKRKLFSLDPDNIRATKALGILASNFLMARPWCDGTEERLEWEDYIYRHEHQYRKTYSGFSSCFLRTLEGLVVKTRAGDVEKDIVLPPMHHRVVFLKPCWFDKMTANLFIQILRTNAITSERTDIDYLFHKKNVKERHHLIRNLRQSNFAWTSLGLSEVISTLEASDKYLAKKDKNCSLQDAQSLLESSQVVYKLTTSKSWTALSKAHEVGMAVEDWPENSKEAFALGYPADPTMIGVTQMIEGQRHVDSNLFLQDPTDGLEFVGHTAKAKDAGEKMLNSSALQKTGVPSSLVGDQQPPTGRRASGITSRNSPQKPLAARSSEDTEDSIMFETPFRPRKRKLTFAEETAGLPVDSSLHKTRLVGTTSAKLTYLLDKVMQHQATEKIIIFYDGDNAAVYIAQCLELMYINHRIYAKTLNNTLRSEYVRLFNEDPDVRVLLIDVACGALGLNLNAASVVLIVNPINRPGLEAQAIKRAHRIGQTKEVYVETLVLENTIEHAIFNRAKNMSRADHQEAKELEDDAGITEIIQNAQIIPVHDGEGEGQASFALLKTPQQIFGRPNRHKYHRYGVSDAKTTNKPQKKAKTLKSNKVADVGGATVLVTLDSLPTLPMRSQAFGDMLQGENRPVDNPVSSIFGGG